MKRMFISDNPILLKNGKEGYLSYPVLASIGFSTRQHYRDSEPHVFLPKTVSFEDLWKIFLKKKTLILNIGQIRFCEIIDCCISLFYNPFFPDFYQKFKTDYNTISKRKIRIIYKHLLRYLVNLKDRFVFGDVLVSGYTFYQENSVYTKCNELINLIQPLI